jgi:septum formation protein
MHRLRLILASGSPRRREILAALGLDFDVRPVDADETPLPGETAAQMVDRLARAKAEAAAAPGSVVVGADTAVVLDGEMFAKPADRDDAVRMLLRLSGREHEVLTGVAVAAADRVDSVVSRTRVRFRDIRRDEALDYWQSGEPQDKAGGYGIQGLGGVFVSNIEGSYSGVVGLPVFETATLLARAGVRITGIASDSES